MDERGLNPGLDEDEAVDAELEQPLDGGNPEAAEDSRDEGDIAADYLEELLDIADIDGDLEIDDRDGRMFISITAEGSMSLQKLSSPDVVDALQQLARLAVQTETGEFSRLILDVGGSREVRKQQLATLVNRAMEKLDAGAASAALPPMSSYERKIVHDMAAERGLVSESEGEARDRHTVLRRA